MDMENIKNTVKESIIQNFMEAAKFAPRGAQKQRPKSWDKGTKSGSEKRKMREQGKREAREINEEQYDRERDARAMGYLSAAHADAENWGRSPEDIKHSEEIAKKQTEERSSKYKTWSQTNILPLLKKHNMEKYVEEMDLSGMPKYQFSHPNLKSFIQDFITAHTAGIEDNKKTNYGEVRRAAFHRNAIADAKRRLDLDERLNKKVKQQTSSEPGWPNREEQRKHAPHEYGLPDDWGRGDLSEGSEEMQAELTPKQSRQHSIDAMLKLIKNAHESAIAHVATSHGKGGKHEKGDAQHMLGRYHEHMQDLLGPGSDI